MFVEVAERTFALTPLSECLRSAVPGSAAAGVIVTGELELRAWQRVLDGLRSDEIPFGLAHGAPIFEHLARPEQAEMARLFDGCMSGATALHARALVKA